MVSKIVWAKDRGFEVLDCGRIWGKAPPFIPYQLACLALGCRVFWMSLVKLGIEPLSFLVLSNVKARK
jgi:hypothetical protein